MMIAFIFDQRICFTVVDALSPVHMLHALLSIAYSRLLEGKKIGNESDG